MQRYFASLTIVLLVGTVLTRVLLMKRRRIKAMNFGKIDKTDFLILPIALFYFYIVFSATFNLTTASNQELFHSGIISWVGVLFCLTGLLLLLLSLVSFGRSFRVGIDTDHPDILVTSGVFALSRNPLYLCGVLDCLVWPVLGIPKLDSLGLSWCRYMVVPPSSAARRRIPEEALRQGILRVLQSSK